MNDINHSILCDVTKCKFNASGKNCTLNRVKISNDCTDCTCCASFSAQDCCD